MLLVPDFYKKFKCIADKCTDSCCVGWEIEVDEKTLAKYKACPDCTRILQSVELNADTPYIRLDGEGRCPHLDGRGLCKIISLCGEDYIPEICKRHPRYYNEILGFTECSIGLSCPTAAEIILSLTEKPKIEKIENTPTNDCENDKNRKIIPTSEENTIKKLYEIREMLFEAVFDRELGITRLLAGLVDYQARISDYLFDGTPMGEVRLGEPLELSRLSALLPRAFSEMELLSEDFRALSQEATPDRLTALIKAHEGEARALLYYFLHRYFLSGAESFDLDDRLTLCVLLLLIALLFVDGRGAVEGAVLFSKNIEYSTENIEILLSIIAEGY